MSHIVDRAKLYDQLNKANQAVSKGEIIVQSDCFVFMGDGKVYTYNDEIAIICEVEVNLKGAVKASELLSFLGKLKVKQITIKSSEQQMLIVAGKVTAGFAYSKEIGMPIEDLHMLDNWKPLPAQFTKAVKVCSGSCAASMDRAALHCVCFRGDIAYGCDGHQISKFVMDKSKMPPFKNDFLVPLFAAKHLHKYGKVKQWDEYKGFMYFLAEDGTIFCSRKIKAKYPDMEAHLDFKGKRIKFPAQVYDSLDRAGIFSSGSIVEKDALVHITIEKGKCEIKSQNSNGWVREKIKVNYDGEEIGFMINPSTLKNALKRVGLESTYIGKKMIRFSNSKDNFTYAAMIVKK